MNRFIWGANRRTFLKGSAAALGAGAVSGLPFSGAFGAAFPDHPLAVVVPTAEGGGADRNLRAVTTVWPKYLPGAAFEMGYFPGASGRVGYEVYMGKNAPDCYSLLFGNMGPEVLNWVVQAPDSFKFPGDYQYFAHVDIDPSVVYVAADSPFRSIDDIVAEAKKRTISVATSRIAHPASLGILAVGEATGGKFNLIPMSGGKKTLAAVVTGETDIGVLPSGSVVTAGDSVRTVLVFDKTNPLGERLNNAPAVNDALGTKIPPLFSARAFALHTAAMDKYPDRYQALVSSLEKTVADQAYRDEIVKAKAPLENIRYGDGAACQEYVDGIIEIGNRFKSLLTGN